MSLSIRNLKKSYVEPGGRHLPILNVESFAVASAEQVVLVGSSGCGKTTLLNVIAGVTACDSGEVTVDGTDVTKLSESARDRFRALKIGYVFQTFNLLPAFTALENVLLGMSPRSAGTRGSRASTASSAPETVRRRTAAGRGGSSPRQPAEPASGG